MAASTLQVTPEHWSELIAARRQRYFCAEQVEAIKHSCQTQCGKGHITECGSCYGKALERMRRRYSESEEREWFTERKAFLQELDGLFSDAKGYKRSVKSIEARIESEKEAWYRWVLRRYPQFLAVCDDGAHQEELRGMLDDPDRSRDEVVEMMWQGIGKPLDWSQRVDALAERVAAVGGNDMELKRLYIHEFFLNQMSGDVLDNARLCLHEYDSNMELRLEEIVGKIAHSTQESRRTRPQREYHKQRLEELKRAKMAFEHNRRLAKSRAKAQEATAGEDLYGLPLARSAATRQTCYDAGHEIHVEAEHDCEAGDHCVQFFDEDVVMENGVASATFACKDCYDEKRAALFCSERCAYSNIGEHRQRMHGGGMTIAIEIPDLILALTDIVERVLQQANPGLKMGPVIPQA
ncbi:hypothetical protein PT974_01228 [Cladobotryum mycophilum]|uniref:C2H2-type domain-containing protein n=1 Tax=Cladobotryum mycophilum TaxID=491253 RepID=A0ABR0T3C3_9HYPO